MAEIYPKKEFTSSGSEEAGEAEHTPFVPPHVQLKELTVKSILLGLLFALVFGASSAFLGLRTGITIGGSPEKARIFAPTKAPFSWTSWDWENNDSGRARP